MKHIISLFVALMLLLSAALAEDNRHDDLGLYGEYDMWPVQRDGLWGFVDQHGKLIIPCEWEAVGMVVNGRAPVCKDGKWGAIDQTGELIVPCKWTMLFVHDDGGFIVNDDGHEGALAADGTVVIPCGQYDSVGTVIDGVRLVRQGDKWGICSEDGTLMVDCQWENPGYFHNGLAYVSDLSGWCFGYVNEQGEMVIPCEYRQADDFVNGSAVVRGLDGSYQLIDTSGSALCAEPWDEMEIYTANDLIMVRKSDRYGYINRKGEVVIPLIYDRAQAFGDGLALVKLGEDTFWIDESGEKALDRPEGYTSFPFQNGLAAIRNAEGLNGLMDKQGRFITPCQWENYLNYAFGQDEVEVVVKGDQCGFINKQGAFVTGRMHASDAVKYGMDGDYLFLLENGVLSIWHADGTKVY